MGNDYLLKQHTHVHTQLKTPLSYIAVFPAVKITGYVDTVIWTGSIKPFNSYNSNIAVIFYNISKPLKT